ncbi:MAG: arsenite methyltransferase [Candidatus Heimdallarchaeota archaeon]|nr:arsenite methyltransferase [Candidatus Heimdallarchaeota archaeon]MCG3255553.1 arsenite methyltransferase [Candidatus Heimdallarchaeota archaeon]MCK4610628.1 arsenite methyltransferase [Candidatus Heimdallarchaeota archaeon]
MEKENLRKVVRDRYGNVAKKNTSCYGSETELQPKESSCCGTPTIEEVSKAIGYTLEELSSIPEASNMGLGCGNPTAIAEMKEGEVVLDLGSGGGLDCFLSAKKVGTSGKVIGVDMTPDMVDLARKNARKFEYGNVEFRLGEIENIPVADDLVDVIISNCVINLSPEKQRVFNEAFRVLKPGGRISISDMVLLQELPESIRKDDSYLAGCVAGAELKPVYLEMIKKAGFTNIEVSKEEDIPDKARDFDYEDVVEAVEFDSKEEELAFINKVVESVTVTAFKPNN